MPTLGKAFVIIQASLLPLKKGLALARRAVTASMRSIARTIRRASILIAGALTGAIIAAAKFREQMAFVSTMLDERTMPSMVGFEKAVKRMSVTFGESTKTLSRGLFDILSASIDVSKATKVLEVAAKTAAAGMTTTAIAADALTSIINAYAMDADSAAEISDKLFATVKRGKLIFPELAQSIGMVASTAAISNLSLDELLATISTLTRAGIKTSEAVTAINGVLRAFLKPTDEAVKTAKKFGLELSTNTLNTIGFTGAVKKLNKASAAQLAQIVPRIRGFKAIAAALKNEAGLQSDLALISEDSAGRTAEAFEKITAELPFKFRQLKQDIVATFRELGEPLLRPVEAAFALIRIRLQSAQKWFADNADTIESWGIAAVNKINDVVNQLATWFDMLKGGQAAAAFKEMGESIKNNLRPVFQFMKDELFPIAKELGIIIGNAIVAGVSAGTKVGVSSLIRNAAPPVAFGQNIKAIRVEAERTVTLDVLKKIERNTDPSRDF